MDMSKVIKVNSTHYIYKQSSGCLYLSYREELLPEKLCFLNMWLYTHNIFRLVFLELPW